MPIFFNSSPENWIPDALDLFSHACKKLTDNLRAISCRRFLSYTTPLQQALKSAELLFKMAQANGTDCCARYIQVQNMIYLLCNAFDGPSSLSLRWCRYGRFFGQQGKNLWPGKDDGPVFGQRGSNVGSMMRCSLHQVPSITTTDVAIKICETPWPVAAVPGDSQTDARRCEEYDSIQQHNGYRTFFQAHRQNAAILR